jgi:hypothetical protein
VGWKNTPCDCGKLHQIARYPALYSQKLRAFDIADSRQFRTPFDVQSYIADQFGAPSTKQALGAKNMKSEKVHEKTDFSIDGSYVQMPDFSPLSSMLIREFAHRLTKSTCNVLLAPAKSR